MARLSPEITATIEQLRQQLIALVDTATGTEFHIFDRHGENDITSIVLEEMKNVAEEASSRFNQLGNLQLRIAESQPIAAPDILESLERLVDRTRIRLPAWQRSIEEIQLEWNLL
jgi:hypothetical protein